MGKNRDFIIFLEDIVDSAELIEKYTKNYSKKKFSSDEQVRDAVIRRFEIIGEAAKHLPPNIKKNYKDIDWKKIAGMRDILIHEYFGVNIDKVWKTIKEDIPDLRKKILKIVKDLEAKRLFSGING